MKRIFSLAFFILTIFIIPSLSFGADEWDKTKFANDTLIPDAPGLMRVNNEAVDRMIGKFRQGAKLTYNSASTIDISSGNLSCSNSTATVRHFRENTSTTSLTFADIDTGSEASSTTYYVYAVCDADAATFTGVISINATTPSGATYYIRLGQFVNDGSSNITAIQNDNENIIVATGTVSNGGTISLPSGWAQDECDWTVGGADQICTDGSGETNGGISISVSSSRVATCSSSNNNPTSCGSTTCNTNYMIVCYR